MQNIYSNPVTLKVLDGGTPRSDVNLCPSCVQAHVFTAATGDKRIVCYRNYYHPMPLKKAIVACNSYLDRTQPSLQQMQEIAWSLMTDKGGRKLGFKPPDRHDGQTPTIGF